MRTRPGKNSVREKNLPSPFKNQRQHVQICGPEVLAQESSIRGAAQKQVQRPEIGVQLETGASSGAHI